MSISLVNPECFSNCCRYFNTVVTGLNVGVWRYEEDRQVWMEGEHPSGPKPCWSRLARELGNRNDNQLLLRYKCLKKSKFPLDDPEVLRLLLEK